MFFSDIIPNIGHMGKVMAPDAQRNQISEVIIRIVAIVVMYLRSFSEAFRIVAFEVVKP